MEIAVRHLRSMAVNVRLEILGFAFSTQLKTELPSSQRSLGVLIPVQLRTSSKLFSTAL